MALERWIEGQRQKSNTEASTEVKKEIQRFTDKEKQVLLKDGAVLYGLTGETITAQREIQERKRKPSFFYVVDSDEMLVSRPSMLSEVAIYPDPKRFFVPNTGGKSVAEQEELVEEDSKKLRKRLGLEEITVIIPEEAATLTEVIFRHLDENGDWLFGEKYARAHGLDFIYGRTKNPTNKFGSFVAFVGDANPDFGLDVDDGHRDDGLDRVWAVRLVVPNRK